MQLPLGSKGENMTRLKVPAIYEIIIGSNRLNGHRMDDLVEAVKNMIERSPFNEKELLGPLIPKNRRKELRNVPRQALERRRLLYKFGSLNKSAAFLWSNEKVMVAEILYFQVPWESENLFIPAWWSMRVIEALKTHCGN